MDEPTIKKVYTGGTFDLFHSGHVNFLRQCKKIGNHVTVSLNTDEFIFRYKQKMPAISYDDRRRVLLSCKYVDDVIPNINGEDSKSTIKLVMPDFVVVGSDWATKDYYKQMNFSQQWLDDNDITLVYIPYTNHISSTLIKNKL